MSLAARIFTRLQSARFYHDMHLVAADMLDHGTGRTWLDVGCGPGLLTRIAADKGYIAKGIDRNAHMIEAAQSIAKAQGSAATFEVSDIDTINARAERYDVVSASSLLVVLPDPASALGHLSALTSLDGAVLIIEATHEMTRWGALTKFLSGRIGRGGHMLLAWAMARSGRTLSESMFSQPGFEVSGRPLLHGMASAWVIKRKP